MSLIHNWCFLLDKVKHVMCYNLPHYIYSDSPYFKIIPFKEIMVEINENISKYTKKRCRCFSGANRRCKRVKTLLSKKSVFTVLNTIVTLF